MLLLTQQSLFNPDSSASLAMSVQKRKGKSFFPLRTHSLSRRERRVIGNRRLGAVELR